MQEAEGRKVLALCVKLPHIEFVKTSGISIRGCPPQVKQNLKTKARANHRSLNAEVLRVLEREAEKPLAIKGHELANRLRAARKLMSEPEHREFARDIENGIELMRRCERSLEP